MDQIGRRVACHARGGARGLPQAPGGAEDRRGVGGPNDRERQEVRPLSVRHAAEAPVLNVWWSSKRRQYRPLLVDVSRLSPTGLSVAPCFYRPAHRAAAVGWPS